MAPESGNMFLEKRAAADVQFFQHVGNAADLVPPSPGVASKDQPVAFMRQHFGRKTARKILQGALLQKCRWYKGCHVK